MTETTILVSDLMTFNLLHSITDCKVSTGHWDSKVLRKSHVRPSNTETAEHQRGLLEREKLRNCGQLQGKDIILMVFTFFFLAPRK